MANVCTFDVSLRVCVCVCSSVRLRVHVCGAKNMHWLVAVVVGVRERMSDLDYIES